jgi:hypothetical protein
MDQLQQTSIANTPPIGEPEVSQPFALGPELSSAAAHARLVELRHDPEWSARCLVPGSRERREFDALVGRAALRGTPNAVVAAPSQESIVTPEAITAARLRLNELKADKEFADKVLSDPEGREGREWDRLVRIASGVQPEKPAEPDQAAARPPGARSPGEYYMPGEVKILDTPEAAQQVAEARELAHSHGLTHAEFGGAAAQAFEDTGRFAGMTDEQKGATLDAELDKIWGVHNDRVRDNIDRYFDENPGLAQRIHSLGLTYNKRVAMIVGDLANAKFGLGPSKLRADATPAELADWTRKTERAYPVEMNARTIAIGIEKKQAGR